MKLREEIARRPGLVSGVAIGAIGLAIVIFFLTREEPFDPNMGRADSVQAWYTDDDGVTYFPDSANKVPPFDHKGKPAYRCEVWSCDGGTTKFVTFVARYKPEVKKALEAAYEAMRTGKGDPRSLSGLEMTGLEMKAAKTGDRGWVDSRTTEASLLRDPKCPGGDYSRMKKIAPPAPVK